MPAASANDLSLTVRASHVQPPSQPSGRRNCVQRVRNERATYLMSKLGMPLGNSPDFYINVAKDRSPERLQELRRVAQNFIM